MAGPRSLQAPLVKQLLFADSILGHPRPVGRPHYTWMDGAMQDLSTLLGPGYSWISSKTGRIWCISWICKGGLSASASLAL